MGNTLDAATLKICETNPDIDIVAMESIRLMATWKAQRKYGTVGALGEMKAGEIVHLIHHEVKTTIVKT